MRPAASRPRLQGRREGGSRSPRASARRQSRRNRVSRASVRLARYPGEPPRRLVDDARAACRTRSAGTASGARASALNTDVGIATTPARWGSSRANSAASVPTSALTKYVPCGGATVKPAPVEPAHRCGRAWPRARAANAAYQPSPSRSAAAPAYWNGVAPAKVRNCLAARTAATSGAGPVAQPTFQPVTLNVLPSEEIVSVRSRHPGQRGERDVLEPVEHEVLVDLVGDRDQVVLAARASAIALQLGAVEHAAGRVVRRVDEDRARASG